MRHHASRGPGGEPGEIVFSTADTIVAIATPQGRAGLGVVRLSGSAAAAIAAALVGRATPFTARHATFARLSPLGDTVVRDEVVITRFPAPASYTGEDVVEISAHGSPVVLAGILRGAIAGGARLAEPGEFTLRAFLNGKRDLIQAEAVADLIEAVTPLQARAAFDQLEGTLTGAIAEIESRLFDVRARLEASLDFPDEGYHFISSGELVTELNAIIVQCDRLLVDAGRGRVIREGALIALVGAPNVGKSSLFNALLNANRAIVTAVPGTTRDLLTERVEVQGLSLTLVDTAGLRDATDDIEREGVARARASLGVAELAIVVLDRSREQGPDDRQVLRESEGRPRVIVVNKVDLPAAWLPEAKLPEGEAPVLVSAHSGEGLTGLGERIAGRLATSTTPQRDTPMVTNVRHAQLITEARAAMVRGRDALGESADALPEEFLLADLQEAASRLQEVTGRRSSASLLQHIFERFCIGK